MGNPDTPPADDPIVREVVEMLRELLHRLLMSSVPVWIDLQLTLPQVRTVFAVAHNKASSVAQIARYLGIGEPTASHLIEKLVRAGFVDRNEDPRDRRRAIIRLSPAGERLIERLLGWEGLLVEWLADIPQKNLSSFRNGLNELVISLRDRTNNDDIVS
jgi:MarR family transcriptional regulator, organic hydroperoxide resistance regulator